MTGNAAVLAEYAVPRKISSRRSFWNKSNSKVNIKSISVFPAYSLSLMGHEVSPMAESSQIPSINGRLFTKSQYVSVCSSGRSLACAHTAAGGLIISPVEAEMFGCRCNRPYLPPSAWSAALPYKPQRSLVPRTRGHSTTSLYCTTPYCPTKVRTASSGILKLFVDCQERALRTTESLGCEKAKPPHVGDQ